MSARSATSPALHRQLIALIAALACLCASHAPAVEVSGTGWKVLYNLPDNDPAAGFSDDEFRLHRHLASRIASLGAGDSTVLGTFTWSANEAGAGRILYEIDRALGRGASVAFIGSSSVATAQSFGNNQDYTPRSIDGLLAAHPATFRYAASPVAGGSHHNKIGLFDYSAGGAHGGTRLVFTSSMNFTGASSTQWNIGIEIQGDHAHAIYQLEADELLAGRFGGNHAKSHAHDNATFTLDGRPGQRVRFSPPQDSTVGGDNPESDIIAAIHSAQTRIVFALNKLTRPSITSALIAAADRGVAVIGTMPVSDTRPGGDSHAEYTRLADPASYQTANHALLLPAWLGIDHPGIDDGSVPNLLHAKYAVIDDRLVLHGSPNWTFNGLRSASGNDENLLFLDHPGIAAAFLQHYEMMTRHHLVISTDVLAAWTVSGLTAYGPSPLAPRQSHPHLNVAGWSRGPAVGITGTAAANAWGGNQWSMAQDTATAAAAGSTAGFSLTAPPGHRLTLTTIDPHNFRRSSSGPATVQWQYRVGAGTFSNLGPPIQLPTTTATGNPQVAIDLSAITHLANIPPATPVDFRVVNHRATGTTGTWYLRELGNNADDFTIRGFLTPIPLDPAGGYAAWAAIHLGSQPPDGDHNHDGIPNLLEYALLTNLDGSAPAVLGTLSPDGSTLTYLKRPEAVAGGDVQYTLLVSNELASWRPATPTTDDDHAISISLPVDPLATREFIRLRASLTTNPNP